MSFNKTKVILSTVAMVVFMSGCATSPKTTPVQMGDNQLTKHQLVAEIQKLDAAQEKINSKKGVTGTNVASTLFWWPGLVYTYYDAGEATRLVDQRRAHLTSLYNQKVAQEESRQGKQKTRRDA